MPMKDRLFRRFQGEGALDGLADLQVEKFRFACEKAVAENPDLGFDRLVKVCSFYLDMIRDFPDCDLGGFNPPERP